MFLNQLSVKLEKAELSEQGESVAGAPTIENFKVVPISDYHRKHIRIDTGVFHRLLNEEKLIQKPLARTVKPKSKYHQSVFSVKNQNIGNPISK